MTTKSLDMFDFFDLDNNDGLPITSNDFSKNYSKEDPKEAMAMPNLVHSQLSRGEICVVKFIPPANGASLGSYLSKNGCFWAKTGKMGPIKTALVPKPANFF